LAGDAEALRETIHEIKTPLNAIIGFAEIIDGQYLGPAHRNYRQRAAEIVAQARMLLAADRRSGFCSAPAKPQSGRG
jgi:signal transduction histidine kinase